MELTVDPEEERLFDAVRRGLAHSGETAVVRVAGGWVRDRLLGRASSDIDLVVDGLSELQYADAVKRGLLALRDAHHQSGASDGPAVTVGTIGHIKSNPALGKHVAVATVCLLDRDIDICCLRSEQMGIPATPSTDAMLRDFTVNALFYNLDSRVVEDWSGKARNGIEDLQARVLRTPKDARDTLAYDALRAFRGVRLACQLGFSLAPELSAAIAQPDVRALLRDSIAFSRIDVELTKMLGGSQPLRALRLLAELQLVASAFPVAFECRNVDAYWSSERCTRGIECCERLLANDTRAELQAAIGCDPAKQQGPAIMIATVIRAAFLLSGYGRYVITTDKSAHTHFPFSRSYFKTYCKLSGRDASALLDLLEGADRYHELMVSPLNEAMQHIAGSSLDAILQHPLDERVAHVREQLGLWIRSTSGHWRICAKLSLAAQQAFGWQSLEPEHAEPGLPTSAANLWLVGLRCIETLGLLEPEALVPCVSARELQEQHGIVVGKDIGSLLEHALCWRLRNPRASESEREAWIAATAANYHAQRAQAASGRT